MLAPGTRLETRCNENMVERLATLTVAPLRFLLKVTLMRLSAPTQRGLIGMTKLINWTPLSLHSNTRTHTSSVKSSSLRAYTNTGEALPQPTLTLYHCLITLNYGKLYTYNTYI